MKKYVVGFMYDDHGHVALIRKNRPQWQAGRLNGIGGHIEEGESPLNAMRREFLEETGVLWEDWKHFVTMNFPEGQIFFFKAEVPTVVLHQVRTTTDEEVGLYTRTSMTYWDHIPNLIWLVPLAMYEADEYEPIEVQAAVAEVL